MQDLILISHNSGWGLATKQIKLIAREELRKQYNGEKAILSIMFVGRTRAKKYNMDYRNMTYVPQVLGFPMGGQVDIDGYVRLGDILICSPLLKDEAIKQNRKMVSVARDWLSHGIENLFKPSAGVVKGLI